MDDEKFEDPRDYLSKAEIAFLANEVIERGMEVSRDEIREVLGEHIMGPDALWCGSVPGEQGPCPWEPEETGPDAVDQYLDHLAGVLVAHLERDCCDEC